MHRDASLRVIDSGKWTVNCLLRGYQGYDYLRTHTYSQHVQFWSYCRSTYAIPRAKTL